MISSFRFSSAAAAAPKNELQVNALHHLMSIAGPIKFTFTNWKLILLCVYNITVRLIIITTERGFVSDYLCFDHFATDWIGTLKGILYSAGKNIFCATQT